MHEMISYYYFRENCIKILKFVLAIANILKI